MKLTMTKGLSGSGKTTWAKLQNAKRVNKDDLRKMLDNSHWSKKNEKFILLIRDETVKAALNSGFDVIVDDTNLAPKHEIALREIAKGFDAEFEVKDFTNIPIEVCIANDLKRFDSVGEAVIRKQYNQFLRPEPAKQVFDTAKHWAVICDIDGTLALFGNANPYDRDFSKDTVNTPIVHILDSMINDNYSVLLVSGRNGKYREDTKKWLRDNSIDYNHLFMREEGDIRKDSVVKEEIFRKHIEPYYNVRFVLDDRDQVVKLWRSLGLTCFQVAEGNF